MSDSSINRVMRRKQSQEDSATAERAGLKPWQKALALIAIATAAAYLFADSSLLTKILVAVALILISRSISAASDESSLKVLKPHGEFLRLTSWLFLALVIINSILGEAFERIFNDTVGNFACVESSTNDLCINRKATNDANLVAQRQAEIEQAAHEAALKAASVVIPETQIVDGCDHMWYSHLPDWNCKTVWLPGGKTYDYQLVNVTGSGNCAMTDAHSDIDMPPLDKVTNKQSFHNTSHTTRKFFVYTVSSGEQGVTGQTCPT